MLLTQDELIAELEAMRESLTPPFTSLRIEAKLYAVSLSGVLKSALPPDDHFTRRGWQLTQKGTGADDAFPYFINMMIEPSDPAECDRTSVGRRLFHATDASNEAAIRSEGLLVQRGGTTFTKRSYTPPRVHLATTMDFAIQFARSVDGHSLEKRDWRIIEFRVPEGAVFHPDPLLNPGGVWSTEGIPADHIEAVHGITVEAAED